MADKIMKTLNGYEVYDEYARTQLGSKLDKSGGTVTGSILSDDAYMHDIGSETNPFGIVYAGTFSGDLSGNATTATTASACSGNAATATTASSCTGNAATATTAAACSGNSATATKLATAKTISLTGDVTGSTSFDGSGNVSITTTVADDSHNHVISNVDGLQAALDGKAASSHTHAGLVNGNGGMVNLLWTADGSSYVFVPRSAATGDTYTVSLGESQTKFLNLHLSQDAYIGNSLDVGGDTSIGGTLGVTGITTASARIQPYASSQVNLGYSSNRWMNIYSNSNVNVSSDINVKKDIVEIDDRYIELFDLVKPYAYKFVDGTSGRVHTGFISQYVEDAMKQVGLTAEELAFFCKDIETEPVYDEDGNYVEDKEVLDEDGNPVYYYSLRYGEYVAIMSAKIKHMEKRIDELEARLAKLEV